jgi:hypothetical protein
MSSRLVPLGLTVLALLILLLPEYHRKDRVAVSIFINVDGSERACVVLQ